MGIEGTNLNRGSALRLRQLNMLVSLVETGSASKTALRLGLTQSAVTKCLKELESSVGAPLFHRESTGLRPTIYCPPMESFAAATVREFDNAIASIRALLKGEQGVVRVAAAAGRPQQLLMSCVSWFADDRAGIGIRIRSGSGAQMLSDLQSGAVDLAVMSPPIDLDPTQFDYAMLGFDNLMLLVRPSHPALAMPITPEQLTKATWILPPIADPLRQLVRQHFVAVGVGDPTTVIETDSTPTAAELSCLGDMVAVVPELVGMPYVESGRLCGLPLVHRLPRIGFGLVTSRSNVGEPAARSVAAKMRACVPDAWSVDCG